MHGTGDPRLFDLYKAGLPFTRDIAVFYAPLNRCVTLVSGTISQLITGAGPELRPSCTVVEERH